MKAQFVLLAVLAAGCNQGRVSIEVGDAPADGASEVIVQFGAVVIEKSDGATERFALTPPLRLDLLRQQRGQTVRVLNEAELEEGDYRAIRFEIDADGTAAKSSVLLTSGRVGLNLASEEESRLRMPIAFAIDRDRDLELVVDFDLRQSVRARTGDQPFPLRPVLRVFRADDVGSLSGQIPARKFPDPCVSPFIYAYRGSDQTPDDFGGALEPYTSGAVSRVAPGSDGTYKIGLLPVDDYTLAFTCQGADDLLESNEPGISFPQKRGAHVSAGRDTQTDF